MKINYLDLFSGVGGFTKGLLGAGFTFDWHGFSEIDKYAVRLYQGLYPTAEAIGDITNISVDELRGLSARIGGINLITFGFPCQDLSTAGNRKGLEGKRSGLFFEALRIIEAVRPDCFIFENVKGLFSSKNGADFKAVLQAVADIGLYDCQWQLLNTNWFLPQDRERIYFVGLLRGQKRYCSEIFPFSEHKADGHSYDKTKGKIRRCHIARTLTARQYASWDGNYIKYPDGAIRQLTPRECFRLQFGMKNAGVMIEKAKELGISDTQLYKQAGNAVSSPVVQCIAERLLKK